MVAPIRQWLAPRWWRRLINKTGQRVERGWALSAYVVPVGGQSASALCLAEWALPCLRSISPSRSSGDDDQ